MSDTLVDDGIRGSDEIEYYGGHLVAESIAPSNMPLILNAPAMHALLTHLQEMYGLEEIEEVLAKVEGREPRGFALRGTVRASRPLRRRFGS